ncbi:MAG: sulfite exporter TauE/SafE family protein [Spirochaetales bacterium]|nr:sulfite exporter TauE/SafE family protein [Spirochaetales bacterium]
MHILLTFVIGLLAGNITGIIGASGVMVVVPAFILLGYTPAASIGASLFIDTIASLIVAITYYQHKNLVIKDGFWIAIGSVVGAQAGSYYSMSIPTTGLSTSFSVFLLISAIMLWVNGKKGYLSDNSVFIKNKAVTSFLSRIRKFSRLSGLILGLIVGIISGFFGAGGGIMILIILIFVMGFSLHEGIGTSTLIMAFTAASGTIGHLVTDALPLKIAIFGTIGTVIGSRLSATYANKINENVLCKVAAVLFASLGIFLFIVGKQSN